MDVAIRSILKDQGFRYAIVVAADVTVQSVGSAISYHRIWANAENDYLASMNNTYKGVCQAMGADCAYRREEL